MTTLPVIPLETIQASLTEAEILDAVKGALIAQARGETLVAGARSQRCLAGPRCMLALAREDQ